MVTIDPAIRDECDGLIIPNYHVILEASIRLVLTVAG